MLRTVVRHLPDPTLVLDPDGLVVDANPLVEAVFGVAARGLEGQRLDALVPGVRLEGREPGQVFGGAGRRADGTTIELELALGAFTEGHRRLLRVRELASGPKVTKITPARAPIERVLDMIPEFIAVVDGVGHLEYVNRLRHNRDPAALLGRNTFDTVAPQDRAATQEAFRRALAQDAAVVVETTFVDLAGVERRYVLRMQRMPGAPDHPRVLAVASDVTELRDAEDDFRQLTQETPTALVVLEEGVVTFANPAAGRLLSRGGVDPVGRRLSQCVGPGEAPPEVSEGTAEWRATFADGVQRDLELRTFALRGTEGRRRAVMLRDVTGSQKISGEALDFRVALEHAVEGFARIGADGRFEQASAPYAALLGYDASALVGRDWRGTFSPESEAVLGQALARMEAEGRTRLEANLRRGDGTITPALVTLVRGPQGSSGHYCFAADLTDQRKAQQQLLVSDRMASVGLLAAGVAHEINNPLASLLSNVDLALGHLDEREPDLAAMHAELTEAREAIGRVRQIASDLKVFSRSEPRELTAVDVHAVVESTLRMAWNEIRHRARLVKDLRPVPPVKGNDARVGQVILNLVMNAAQAIEEGSADRNEIRVATKGRDGWVAIEVVDTGPGIAPELSQRLFTPFQTTKAGSGGTGLGLSICQRLVSELGGRIELESRLGEGTRFTVLLPALSEDARVVPVPKAVPVPVVPRTSGGRAKVLVVDDEQQICNVMRRILSSEHDVEVLTEASVALARIVGGARYDVLFCDLMMPRMTGMQLHASLAHLVPDQAARMVFLTGGAFTRAAQEFLEATPHERFEKPFEPSAIREIVRRRLAPGKA